MTPEPRWYALISVLVAAAIGFAVFSEDAWRALPPAFLALAMIVFLAREGSGGPESMSPRRRDRLAVTVFMGLAIVTALAAIAVFVIDAL